MKSESDATCSSIGVPSSARSFELRDRRPVARQDPVELLPHRQRQHVAERAAFGIAGRLQELQRRGRVVQVLGRYLEHHPVRRLEGGVDVGRDGIVVGLEQVERTQQINAVVGIRHLPQQRDRRVVGGLGQRRGRGSDRSGLPVGTRGGRRQQGQGKGSGKGEAAEAVHGGPVRGWKEQRRPFRPPRPAGQAGWRWASVGRWRTSRTHIAGCRRG